MSGKYALIIGNTEYTEAGLAQLTAPGKDAEDFARILQDKEICAFDEVSTLQNQPEHVIRRSIDEFFDQKKPDDLLILYFSGHGVRDELGALYLAVINTDRFRLRSTAIKSDFIREAMYNSRSRRQVLILDCCNSGAFAQGTKAATGVSIGTSTAFEAGYGRIILTASDSTQFAWEGDKVIGEPTDNSLFTHFLVKGLEGEADLDGDGRITVDDLYEYAHEKVRTAKPTQTPWKFADKQQGEIVLRDNVEIKQPRPMPALPDDVIASIEAQVLNKVQAKLEAERIAKEKASEEARIAEEKRLAEEKAKAERKAKKEADRIAKQKIEETRLAEEKRLADEKAVAEQAKRERARIAAQKTEEERMVKARFEAKVKAAREEVKQFSDNATAYKPVNSVVRLPVQEGSKPPLLRLKEASLENFLSAARIFFLLSWFIDVALLAFGFSYPGTPGKEIPWYLTALQIIAAIVAGFYFGFVVREDSPSPRQFKDTSKDSFWLQLASHAWGLVGSLLWGFLSALSLLSLTIRFIEMESQLATYASSVWFILGIGIGIERWDTWKNGARDFLIDSSNNQ